MREEGSWRRRSGGCRGEGVEILVFGSMEGKSVFGIFNTLSAR